MAAPTSINGTPITTDDIPDVAVRLGDRLVLSPSQLASVLACPRQYFLSREAKHLVLAGNARRVLYGPG